MKKFIYTITFFFSLFISISFAQQTYTDHHPLSGAFTITAEGGGTIAQTDFQKTKIGTVGKLSLDYFFPTSTHAAFGLKLFGGAGDIQGEGGATKRLPDVVSFKTPIVFAGAGPEFSYGAGIIYPYLFAGFSFLHFNPRDMDKNGNNLPENITTGYSKNEVNYNLEFGIKFMLSNHFSFNIASAAHISPNDNLDDINNYLSNGVHNDMFFTFTAGFSYNFTSSSNNDEDGDGVPDNVDLCPNTPQGVQVDEFGCAIDSDRDGVPDYLDKCPNTALGEKVDKNGCSIDSDRDGVPDDLDKCPNTPIGAAVDKSGCPLDSDHDGVPDYLDKCPNTKPGVKVDKNGCEITVGAQPGKPAEKPQETKELTLNGEANFEFGKTDLTSNAKKVLDGLIQTIKEHPDAKWRIEGYSDNVGSYDANKRVSLKRAQAVLNYLVEKGLNPSMFEVYAYGSDNPIADNKTDYGRALNRRVVIREAGTARANKSSNVQFTVIRNAPYDYANDKIVKGTIFTDGEFFTIQVSSWSTQQKAEQEITKLRKMGHNAMMYKATVNGQEKYRVRIGYFKTEKEAEAYIHKYFALGQY
jgi:outer membrane protein OmpA-like peptidoglycan-associated protein